MERKGFLVFFINLPDTANLKMEDYIELVRKNNETLFEMSSQDGYPVMIFPVFNEACRVQKIELEDIGTLQGA
jgi:hypothetical protein